MSALGSLYIKLGEPDGPLHGCCETADWAAQEIERLRAEISDSHKALEVAGAELIACSRAIEAVGDERDKVRAALRKLVTERMGAEQIREGIQAVLRG